MRRAKIDDRGWRPGLEAGRQALQAACMTAPDVEDLAARPSGLRILLAEDLADVREMTQLLLELEGHQVEAVANGRQAVEALHERPFDLALIDIGLPDIDGYEVVRQSRRAAARFETLLVALTGYGWESDRQRAKEAGFHEHLVKPLPLDELQELIRRCQAREAGS